MNIFPLPPDPLPAVGPVSYLIFVASDPICPYAASPIADALSCYITWLEIELLLCKIFDISSVLIKLILKTRLSRALLTSPDRSIEQAGRFGPLP